MVFLNRLGSSTLRTISTYTDLLGLWYDMVTRLLFNRDTRVNGPQLVNQILFTGVDAFFTITLIAISLGVALSTQLVNNVANIDVTSFFGTLLALSIKEVSPFITAVVIIGRSGSGFTTFLGNMKVTRETDALKAMAIPVIDFLCIPNFVGMVIATLALNFYFSSILLLSGLATINFLTGRPVYILIEQVFSHIVFIDIMVILLKCIIFGSVVATTSSYFGLHVKTIRIVPRAVFRTVVTSIIFILLANIALALISTFLRGFLL
ncbi:ABC transporter permease [Chitinivibrio alkaliphilus]|uniref:ABC transporter, permease protein n=1 Tax=Chitinivibrio alkaliphilus ACht1 TaxID=1313304 RepID=U7DC40_9BACT|nr:ABC transporter permease [Chitinivibrio alkaliphilus]ERP39148.1 ABC transporter, permease protein [Chitinivibrio alkaliphilus ACht1]